ncbi:hypothetical protein NDU88_002866 [Pleurodeles waltl]|uniref:Uncharacterized protein n=1 Tax=Pleurodeles waltl TaxID=8319 RepID=A0AAV7TME6_PLEWA|nr:hypothetical protein NDU88_002866 [Pleurodeles waltl]
MTGSGPPLPVRSLHGLGKFCKAAFRVPSGVRSSSSGPPQPRPASRCLSEPAGSQHQPCPGLPRVPLRSSEAAAAHSVC